MLSESPVRQSKYLPHFWQVTGLLLELFLRLSFLLDKMPLVVSYGNSVTKKDAEEADLLCLYLYLC